MNPVRTANQKLIFGCDNGDFGSEDIASDNPIMKVGAPKGGPLNLRALPTMQAALICTVPNGTSVHIVGPDSKGWTPISHEGTVGYVWSAYLTGQNTFHGEGILSILNEGIAANQAAAAKPAAKPIVAAKPKGLQSKNISSLAKVIASGKVSTATSPQSVGETLGGGGSIAQAVAADQAAAQELNDSKSIWEKFISWIKGE